VTANSETINTLLVSGCGDCAGILHKALESDGINGHIHRVDVHGDALTRVRERCRDRSDRRPDFIFFDLLESDDEKLTLLAELAFGAGRCPIPVVVITSPESEQLLQSGAIDGGNAVMFSPISLEGLISTLRNKRRNRFVRALSVIYAIGPVLVQAPSVLFKQQDEHLALTA